MAEQIIEKQGCIIHLYDGMIQNIEIKYPVFYEAGKKCVIEIDDNGKVTSQEEERPYYV